MRTLILLIGLLALPAFASQTVWKWVDEKGVTHFSDQPVPGATKQEISSSNTNAGATPRYTGSSSAASPVDTGPSYRSFEISTPVNDQNFVNTGGQVKVALRIDPALQPGHQMSLMLDGRPVAGFPRNTSQFDLKEVPRGTHTVQGEIQDSRGTRLQETAPVTFYVRQESMAKPPVSPALRPPVKPRS